MHPIGTELTILVDRPSGAVLRRGDTVVVTGHEEKYYLVKRINSDKFEMNWYVRPRDTEPVTKAYSPEQSGDTDDDI